METGVNRIKGAVISARLSLLRREGGQELVDRVLGLLPEADRLLLRETIPPMSWHPMEMGLRLDAAMAEALSPGDRARAFMEMGRASADENLKGAHSYFLRPGDPHYLLSKAPQIYRFYYDVGRRTYEKVGPTAAVLRTFGAELVTQTDCLTVMGWHQRAVEMSGGRNVRVTHPQCRAQGAPHCEYRIDWE